MNGRIFVNYFDFKLKNLFDNKNHNLFYLIFSLVYVNLIKNIKDKTNSS